ncbi:hypothetical protein CHUAL_011070 [Chamberlinius hualienensis]
MLENDGSIDNSFDDEGAGNFKVIDEFCKDAKQLLSAKQYLRNYIVKLRSTVREGSIQLGYETENISERIADLEKKLSSAVTNLKCKNVILNFAQISSRINHHRGWNPTNATKISNSENEHLVLQFERIYLKQIQYMELKREVYELQKIARNKRDECLDVAFKMRSSHSKLEKLIEENMSVVPQKNQKIDKRKEHLLKGMQLYTLMQHTFTDLIFCCHVDWQSDPKLSQLLKRLDEKLEFE